MKSEDEPPTVDAATVDAVVHTPGPWERFGYIGHGGREGLLHVRACVGVDRVGRKKYQELPVTAADAKLIAAAPELLAACKLVSRWMVGRQPGPWSDSAILEIVESAIREATS
jgi:hypothetical protein